MNETYKKNEYNEKSSYIKSQEAFISDRVGFYEIKTNILKYCDSLTENELPPLEFMNKIGSHDKAHFVNNMKGVFAELYDRFKLNENFSILDIGCGCGRLTYPFAKLIKNGKYFGIDVWEDGINMLKAKFSNENNLNFYTLKANNNYYYEEFDKDILNDFKMPEIKSSEVDLTFAISVFTHLTKNDVTSYLKEINRILKSGGCAYITCFIIDSYFHQYVERTGMHKGVKLSENGCYYAYSKQDFFAGYELEYFKKFVESSGLKIVSQDLGSWAEKPGSKNYQDTFILYKE